MSKSPLEMTLEEIDAAYGPPKSQPAVLYVVIATASIHHDRISIEVINAREERLLLTFSQDALKELIAVAGGRARAKARPKVN